MGNHKHEHIWHAYIDGELSTSEAAEFEASLSESDRARLVADMRFERGFAERLGQNAECPDEVWARTQALLTKDSQSGVSRFAGARRRYWGGATLAAAAALAFVISVFASFSFTQDSPAIIMAATTVEELAKTSQSEQTPEAAEQFIRENGVNLGIVEKATLKKIAAPHYRVHVIGARQGTLAGEEVTEILVACCDHPMKIVVARLHSAAADELGLAAAQDGQVQATRVVGDYIAAVVGHHNGAHGLLSLLAQ